MNISDLWLMKAMFGKADNAFDKANTKIGAKKISDGILPVFSPRTFGAWGRFEYMRPE